MLTGCPKSALWVVGFDEKKRAFKLQTHDLVGPEKVSGASKQAGLRVEKVRG